MTTKAESNCRNVFDSDINIRSEMTHFPSWPGPEHTRGWIARLPSRRTTPRNAVISKQRFAIIAKGLASRMNWLSREYFRRISNDVRCAVAENQVRLTTRSNSYPVTQKLFAMARMSTASPANTCWSLSRRTKRVKAPPCRSFVKCFTPVSGALRVSDMA